MTQFSIGDRVVHIDTYAPVAPGTPVTQSPYPNLVGKTATVLDVKSDGIGIVIDVKWDTDETDHGRNWGSGWFEAAEEAPGRPLVHFSDEKAGRNRELARAYAREAVSRTLKDEHNLVLKQAGAGHSVDAYALNAAVTAAIRSAVTRKGQSTARRQQAEHFAHLGHIVQAVLENHADSLPAYESGERSRVVGEVKTALAEAKREIDHSVAVNQRLTQDLTQLRGERTTLTQAASDERRRLCEEIDTLKDVATNSINDCRDAEKAAERARVIADNVLDYVAQFLTTEQAAQVKGFKDGIETEYDYREDV